MKLKCCEYEISPTDAAEIKAKGRITDVYLDADPAVELCVICPMCGETLYGHFPIDKLEPGIE